MKATRSIQKKDGREILCPYFNEHYGGCLSSDMHGLTLASVVDHCGSHYTACAVYRKFAELSPVNDYAGPVEAVALISGIEWAEKKSRRRKIPVSLMSRRCSA
jgi:hypothetical protein